MIKKKKNKRHKIVLLAKSNLNNIEVKISKVLINSVISHEEFVFLSNALKLKDLIKFIEDFSLFIK